MAKQPHPGALIQTLVKHETWDSHALANVETKIGSICKHLGRFTLERQNLGRNATV